ncbi:MAG: MBL fold metallo-hydrolase [Oligoflexia bacterium]|nr:MBL fold metallo-hydrolase [Oligoflexia bacterium]
MSAQSLLPAHLSGPAASGLQENEPIAQFELGGLHNFVYLILDWATRRAAIVDPQKDLTDPLAACERHGFTLESILLTHTHHDHTGGVRELLGRFPGLTLTLGEKDLHRLRASGRLRLLQADTALAVGSLSVDAFPTPGHSAGAFCYRVNAGPGFLLTGDTLFIRDCGRTDLETGSTAEMFRSLQRLRGLAAETVILPGHHYAPECASTLERELRESPPLRCRNEAELAALP